MSDNRLIGYQYYNSSFTINHPQGFRTDPKKDSSFTDKYKMKENKENLKTKKNGSFSDHVYQKATNFNFFTDFQLIFQVDRITNCIHQLKEKRL